MAVRFEYYVPDTPEEFIHLARVYGREAKVPAGGTDLMILIKRAEVSSKHAISAHRFPGRGRLHVNGSMDLGAGMAHRQWEGSGALHG